MRVRYDWAAVQRFYDEGHGRDDCMARFGFTLDAWYKAIRFGRLAAKVQRPHVDWASVQRYYDEGHSYQECRECFGFAAMAWTKAVRRGALVTRPRALPLEIILQKSRNRSTIKRRLLLAGKLRNCCDFAA